MLFVLTLGCNPALGFGLVRLFLGLPHTLLFSRQGKRRLLRLRRLGRCRSFGFDDLVLGPLLFGFALVGLDLGPRKHIRLIGLALTGRLLFALLGRRTRGLRLLLSRRGLLAGHVRLAHGLILRHIGSLRRSRIRARVRKLLRHFMGRIGIRSQRGPEGCCGDDSQYCK